MQGNTIIISIGRNTTNTKKEFAYFVRSKFHKNPQPVDIPDISYVLYRLAKKILKAKESENG